MADLTFFQEDPDYERAVLERQRELDARRQAAEDMATPELANTVVGYSQTWGPAGISPGVATALARAGITPDSPTAQEIAKREYERHEEEEGGIWSKMGGFVSSAGKATIRGAMTAFDTAFEELVSRPARGVVQNYRDATKDGWDVTDLGQLAPTAGNIGRSVARTDTGKSSGRVAMEQLMRDGTMDLGSGFFPGGSAEAEHAASVGERRVTPEEAAELFPDDPTRQQQFVAKTNRQFDAAPKMHGQAITPGRTVLGGVYEISQQFGGTVFEPGTWEYNIMSGMIDASVQLFGDPTIVGGKALTVAREAKRAFGVSSAHRAGVNVAKFVDEFLDGKSGRRVVERIAESTNVEDIWTWLGNPSHKGAGQLVARLRDETDPDKVADELRNVLGYQIREKPSVSRILDARIPGTDSTLTARRSLRNIRMFDEVPGDKLSLEAPDTTLETFSQYLKNAKLDEGVRRQLLERYMRVGDNDVASMNLVVRDAAKQIDRKLGGKGEVGKKMTQLYESFQEAARAYNVDEVGENVPVLGSKPRGVSVGGEVKHSPNQHLVTEMADGMIELPDYREIRRATAKLSGLYETGVVRGLDNYVLTPFTTRWKQAQLMRAAWTTRVIGEEQVRMAAAGLDSGVSHPLSWLSLVVEDGGKFDTLLQKATKARLKGRGDLDVLGELMDNADEMVAARSRGAAGWAGDTPGSIYTGDYTSYAKEGVPEEQFLQMWALELRQLWSDSVSRKVAADGPDAAKEWLFSGEGKRFRQQLAKAGGPDSDKWALADDIVARRTKIPGTEDEYFTSAKHASDWYVDSVMKRIRTKTGGDPELMEVIATQTLNGKQLKRWSKATGKNIKETLQGKIDLAPDMVKGPRLLDQTRGQRFDRAVDTMFEVLMSRPTNYLSRSPAFKQFYWNRMEEIANLGDQAVVNGLKQGAEQAGMHDLAKRLSKVKGAGRLTTMEEVDTAAKAYALKETRNLLYDLDRKSQWADILRNIVPFGEAWKEVATTWTRLLSHRPQAARRMQQTIEGARGADWDNDGRGIFYTDPNTGAEMFNYPLLGAISSKLSGMPGDSRQEAKGQVASLNLAATSVIPGLGPVAQWPVSAAIPNTEGWKEMREILLPFGEFDPDSPGEFVTEAMPAGMGNVVKGLMGLKKQLFDGEGLDERGYQNTVGELAKALIQAGEYQPHEYKQALEEANKGAWKVYLIKGLSNVVVGTPTNPQMDFQAADTEGKWHSTQVLATEYYDMLKRHGGDSEVATEEFVTRFGLDPQLVSQGKTKSLRKRAFDKTGAAWERNNAHLLDDDVKDVFGYFAPSDPDGEFDYEAYLDALDAGDSQELSAQQQLLLYNNTVGWTEYNRLKDKLVEAAGGETDQVKDLLRQAKAELKQRLPGFDSVIQGVGDKPDRDTMIEQFRTALAKPELAETDAGKAIGKYMAFRDKLIARADGKGLGGKRDYRLRVVLRAYGEDLAEDNPHFSQAWTGVFAGEVGDVDREDLTNLRGAMNQ